MVAKRRFIVRVGEDGAVKLPRALLRELGVEPGTYAVIYREGSGIAIRFKASRSPLRLGRQVSTEEVEQMIREALDEVVAARWES
ncbi:MAG: AbrB/MazE/SpoVT family DNA-binding domain-containing protein [Thermofilum sp.]